MSKMSDEFFAWWLREGQFNCKKTRIMNARIAWNAAMKIRYVCLADPEMPDVCVFDRGDHWIKECGYAEEIVFDHKTKHDCQYRKKANEQKTH